MIKLFVDIFMYVFEFLLFFYYSDTLFKEKKSKKVRIISIFLANIIMFFVYQLNITYLNALLIFVMNTLLLLLLYNISIKTAIFHSLIFMVVMLSSEIIVMAISSIVFNDFNALENDLNAYIFVILASKLIYFGVMMVILRLFAQNESNDYSNKYYWILFIMPLASVLMLLSFRYITYQITLSRNMYILWIVSYLVLLLSNILVFIIYEYSIKNTKELYDIKSTKYQEEQDKKYFEIIEQSNKDMRIFAHDIKNHLIQIDSFDNTNDIHSYITKLVSDIEKFSNTGISKNKMLDLIINKYLTICESKNIKFNINIKTANLNYIDDVDLSTLMNNLLDNAVDAAQKSTKKYITINIFSKNNLYDGLIIKNSCDSTPEEENGELKTTKSNLKFHGIGMSSIKKIVKKYNAVYGWKYDKIKKVFETDIAFLKEK